MADLNRFINNSNDPCGDSINRGLATSLSPTKLANTISGNLEVATALSASFGLITTGEYNSERKSREFATKVANLAHSDEVLTELSNAIGKPKKTESEDEFVERAKSTFANILKRKFLGL